MFWFSFVTHKVDDLVYNSGRTVVEANSSEEAREKMLQDLKKWIGYSLCKVVYGPYNRAEEAQSVNPYISTFNKEVL